MLIPLQKLLRQRESPVLLQGEIDLSNDDFPGYEAPEVFQYTVNAIPEMSVVRIHLVLCGTLRAPCARCLADASVKQHIEKDYIVRQEDIFEEFPELPIREDGQLDVKELLVQEILMEAPMIFLCRDDCEGLCPRCGRPKQKCNCIALPQGDERLQVLRSLLTDEE